MSIFEVLNEYAARNPSRWHTPGHKGALNPFDITELADGSFPGDLITIAQQKAAEFYGAKAARFLTGGSSMGIKAAIWAAEGDILAPSYCHQALHEGATLAGVKLSCFDTGLTEYGIAGVPTIYGIQTAIRQNPSVKVVYLESPDYFGRVIDPAIAAAVKAAGKYFFCDAAHGAHFPAHKKRLPNSYAGIADVCNLSAHKTLDAYTQGAYLCVNNNSLTEKIDKALRLLGTTSPSYLLLDSLESAIDAAQHAELEYERLYAHAEGFKRQIPCMPNDDFTRIVVDAGQYGLTGEELCIGLAERRIFCEKYEGACVVFIATPHDTKTDFDRLATAIGAAAKERNETD